MLPRTVWRDVKAASAPGRLDDVAKAFGAASDALVDGDLERAAALLRWAKSAAPRSAAVREALGVVHYLAGDFAAATAELLAYRRLSGREDQNHLLADCARATGHHDRVGDYVERMAAAGVAADRVAEGYIVLAGDRLERGDLVGARAALDRAGLSAASVEPWHPRLWSVAAEVAARGGDVEQAREYLEAIRSVDEDFPDLTQRLAELD